MPRQAVFFLTDTQGQNVLGCYTGDPSLGTPHLDALAASGVRFADARTCCPVCGPARSALFTGLFPHANGVLGNNQAPHLDLPTLGQRLRDAGIAAGYVGKWHLDGTDYFGNGRCPPGWDPDCWFDGRNYLDSLPDDDARDLSRRVLGPDEIARHRLDASFTHAHRSVDRALRFIEKHRDHDFFLVVSIDEPHHPFICPEPFVGDFADRSVPVPAADDPLDAKPRVQRDWAARHAPALAPDLTGPAHARRLRAGPYLACNSYCDHEIGRVLAAIDRHTPSALVVHTSDHGDMLGAHRLLGKGPAMYDEITRVPLLVRWPGHAPAGAVSPHLVSHIDLPATFLDFFGLPVPALLHGVSLLAQFRAPATRLRDEVFLEFNRYEIDHDGFGAFAPIRCIYDGRHKLAINLVDTDELYDLASDPHEERNLIASPAHAAVRDCLHDRLLAWQDDTRDPLRGPAWARRAWRDRAGSSWEGPTRPRPLDPTYQPGTLLYDTARPVDRAVYAK